MLSYQRLTSTAQCTHQLGVFCIIGLSVFFTACSSEDSSTSPVLTGDVNTAFTTANIDKDLEALTALSDTSVSTVPAVTGLSASVRAGLVNLEWQAPQSDVYQTHPSGDTVSYYRIYRNDEFLTDTFSPFFQDGSVSQGEVRYSVESHKLVRSPQYAILVSQKTQLSVDVPSFESEAIQFKGMNLTQAEYEHALQQFKACSVSYARDGADSLCTNVFGYAWLSFDDGTVGKLLPQISSIVDDVLVSVANTESDLGPLPGIPTWTVKTLSTGNKVVRSFRIDSVHLQENESYVVNGVAVAANGIAYISGTLYQSYLPRNLGPEVGLLPVTNGYYIAQLDTNTGGLIQFKRFSLAQMPGVAVSVTNGLLEMHKLGQVSTFNATTLELQNTLRVSGHPVFADNQYVYTQVFGPHAWYRFERTD